MKNIYFVQANNFYGTGIKSIYLPYAAGCLIAHCRKNKTISENYKFNKIIYYRMCEEEFLDNTKEPFAVFFSCSVWNYEYNKHMAQSIKKRYPDCYIIFGGHSVSSDTSDLDKYDYVDFLTHRFGEESTEALLTELISQHSFSSIPNISYRDENSNTVTTEYKAQISTDYPSPYLTGIFDDILKDGYAFSAIMETNRGCPNNCTYCDWGSLNSKVRLFPMDRVKAELEWFAKKKIEFIFCADGNFCLFPRDKEIAEYVIDCKAKYGYPKIFRVCFTKNKLDTVYEIGMMLLKNGLDKAQTISFQSMNEEVLENIGRKNISNEAFRNLMKKYNATNISTFSELILGLPGETYDSFCSGVSTLLDCGQHFSFMVYPCELLPNSQMAQVAYMKKYGINYTKVPFKLVHTDKKEDITEYGKYITSTYSMSEEDWSRSLIFSKYVQALHCLGLLRAIAVINHYENGIQYDRFYNSFINYSEKKSEGLLNRVYCKLQKLCRGILSFKNEFVTSFSETDDMLWDFDEYIFLEFYNNLDEFYCEIKKFVQTLPPCSFSEDIVDYQKDIIKKIGVSDVKIYTEYDFYSYFSNIFSGKYSPLSKQRTILSIEDHNPVFSIKDLAKSVVWFGRNKQCSDYTSHYYQVKIFKDLDEKPTKQ